jgi:hypothetical protein
VNFFFGISCPPLSTYKIVSDFGTVFREQVIRIIRTPLTGDLMT